MQPVVYKDKKKKKSKTVHSLGVNITFWVILFAVAISGAAITVGYTIFKNSITQSYAETGEKIVSTAAAFIDVDDIDRYVETLETDKKYDDTLRSLQAMQHGFDMMALYVFRSYQDREEIMYIYDTEPTDECAELGDVEAMDEDIIDHDRQLRENGEIDTYIGVIPTYGWIISKTEPLYDSNGEIKAFIGVDFDMNLIMGELMTYLRVLIIIVVGVTVIFTVILLRLIRRRITDPIKIMATAADNFLVDDLEKMDDGIKSAIAGLSISTRDEIESLSEALKSMERKINEYISSLNIVTLKSETDPLTKLLNREAFEQQVSAYLHGKFSGDCSVDAFLMIDVDYFKSVNDVYGHIAGDVVLVKCAAALREILRNSDLAGRQGGDEFVVFCKSIGTVAAAEHKARQIREAWLKIIPQGSGEVSDKGVTASIGIALTVRDDTFHALYTNADSALYRAKENGRDGFAVYDNAN